MKKAIILIPLVILLSCSFKYTYKTGDRYPIFTKSDIESNPNIGVAILSEEGSQNTCHIESGINTFLKLKSKDDLDVEITYQDIGSEIELDNNRNIRNVDSILRMYPDIRYTLVLLNREPHVHETQYRKSRTITSGGEEKAVWDTVWETTLSIKSEVILFDLIDNKVLAKAKKKLAHTDTYTDHYSKPSSNFIIRLLDNLMDSSGYPTVDVSLVEMKFENYVYSFLKHINDK